MTATPTLEQCCADARELDTLKAEIERTIGPVEKPEPWIKPPKSCIPPCGPGLNDYRCRGVIRYLTLTFDYNSTYVFTIRPYLLN